MIATTILFVALAFLVLCLISIWALSAIRQASRTPGPRWQWRPPIISGAKLVEWSAKVSEAVTQKLLTGRRTKHTPTQVANEVLSGTTFAIRHLPLMGLEGDGPDCRQRKFGRIGVTAPEVLAIADMIRPNGEEAKRVHEIAQYNAWQLAESGCDGRSDAPLVCPLRTQEGGCIAGSLCPLHCRATCHLGDELVPGHARILEGVARDLGFGVEVGVSRALYAAGLDGNVYELNSALAVALETPNASKQWAEGKDVLANCMHDDYTAYLV